MENLNIYIVEKLIINKNIINQKFSLFCETLFLDKSKNESKFIYELYKNDCEHIIGDNITKNQRMSTDFELLYMICVMLLDDKNDIESINTLGFSNYNGHNNPYDFSWFEEENDDGNTVLDVIQELYDISSKTAKIINNLYQLIKKSCTNYRKSIDGIWELHDIIEN